MNLTDFLTQTAEGEILLTGHRIGLLHVVEHYNQGYSPEMLVGQFPSLPLPLVHKVIAYYLENRNEVDSYVKQCQQNLDEQSRIGKRLDVEELRKRLETIRTAAT